MLLKSIKGIKVKAISSAVPDRLLDQTYFANLYGQKEAARVVRGTGIKSIRVADQQTTEDLITAAANNLLQRENIDATDIDALIVVTQTPSQFSPGAAFAVHALLGLSEHCYVSSVNDGCAGYGNGLLHAASLIASGACKQVLLCTGDVNTRVLHEKDYQVRMLFGDAASATLLSSGDETIDFVTGVDGSGKDMLGVQMHYDTSISTSDNKVASVDNLKMDGAAVMSFALKRVPQVISRLLEHKNMTKSDVGLFAFHQPNEFMLSYLRNILELSEDVLPTDADGYGNTNSTSIPLLLSRRVSQSDYLFNTVLCGFGVGLAWNAVHLNLSNTNLIPPIIVGSTKSDFQKDKQ